MPTPTIPARTAQEAAVSTDTADLTVPDAAVAALHEAGDEPLMEYVRAIAAPVVAAELRRIAGEVLDNAAGLGREPGATTYAEVDTLKGVAHTLLLRADELDPS